MKKIIPFVFLMLVFCTAFAQSKSYKMYDVFSGRDGITDFGFSKSMVDALDINFDDSDGERNVKGDLTEIRFMSYNPEKGDLSGDEFLKKAIGYLPKSAYKKYDDGDTEDDDAEIWLLGKGKKYRECHVFINNENKDGLRFVVSFYGDFKVEDIDNLKDAGRGFSDD